MVGEGVYHKGFPGGVVSVRSEEGNPFRWYDIILLGIIPPLSAFLIKLLMRTCRVVRVEGLERYNDAVSRSGGRALYASWHQRMSYFSRHFHSHRLSIMISRSRDGEYAARIAERLGFKGIRGSSTRGAFGALMEMEQVIRQGGAAACWQTGLRVPPVWQRQDQCFLHDEQRYRLFL